MHDTPHALSVASATGAQPLVVAAVRRPRRGIVGRRRTWVIRPTARPHSTPKGKKGYDRKAGRRKVRNGGEDA